MPTPDKFIWGGQEETYVKSLFDDLVKYTKHMVGVM